MPRRRKTRVASRMKPQILSDNDQFDLGEEERKEKLEAYLKDFDIQVEEKVTEMRNKCAIMCSAIRRAATMYTMKLPKGMKTMKQVDYFAQTSTPPAEKVIEEFSKTVDEMVSKSLPATMISAATSSTEGTGDSDCSETSAPAKKSTVRKKKAASTTTRASTRKRAKAAANQDKVKGSVFQTPANATSSSSLGIGTPFITPKFDTSCKAMPTSVRRAKVGELLVSLSGSPVEAKQSPKGAQSVKQIVENVENFFTQDKALDDMDKQNIIMLQKALSRMLKETADI